MVAPAVAESLSFAALAKRILETSGTKLSPSTVFRWAFTGVRGQKLAIHTIGARHFSTWANYLDFAERLKTAPRRGQVTPVSVKQPKRVRDAERILETAGI